MSYQLIFYNEDGDALESGYFYDTWEEADEALKKNRRSSV